MHFTCKDCPSNDRISQDFQVCSRACQVPFWKGHKQTHVMRISVSSVQELCDAVSRIMADDSGTTFSIRMAKGRYQRDVCLEVPADKLVSFEGVNMERKSSVRPGEVKGESTILDMPVRTCPVCILMSCLQHACTKVKVVAANRAKHEFIIRGMSVLNQVGSHGARSHACVCAPACAPL